MREEGDSEKETRRKKEQLELSLFGLKSHHHINDYVINAPVL